MYSTLVSAAPRFICCTRFAVALARASRLITMNTDQSSRLLVRGFPHPLPKLCLTFMTILIRLAVGARTVAVRTGGSRTRPVMFIKVYDDYRMYRGDSVSD